MSPSTCYWRRALHLAYSTYLLLSFVKLLHSYYTFRIILESLLVLLLLFIHVLKFIFLSLVILPTILKKVHFLKYNKMHKSFFVVKFQKVKIFDFLLTLYTIGFQKMLHVILYLVFITWVPEKMIWFCVLTHAYNQWFITHIFSLSCSGY